MFSLKAVVQYTLIQMSLIWWQESIHRNAKNVENHVIFLFGFFIFVHLIVIWRVCVTLRKDNIQIFYHFMCFHIQGERKKCRWYCFSKIFAKSVFLTRSVCQNTLEISNMDRKKFSSRGLVIVSQDKNWFSKSVRFFLFLQQKREFKYNIMILTVPRF